MDAIKDANSADEEFMNATYVEVATIKIFFDTLDEHAVSIVDTFNILTSKVEATDKATSHASTPDTAHPGIEEGLNFSHVAVHDEATLPTNLQPSLLLDATACQTDTPTAPTLSSTQANVPESAHGPVVAANLQPYPLAHLLHGDASDEVIDTFLACLAEDQVNLDLQIMTPLWSSKGSNFFGHIKLQKLPNLQMK
ncbi:hypothetical protein GOP47_0023400 [Adiantum capillus-veneris]|uniref:Uncharacterized protein n=1 Tax=Adiantum capillus-veneris TaxID=13818 RepID=A0A9D4Z4H2_ADICA|nr:hypothetical protein GOP47_0023400 [Adiantum capillus-veneris]